MTNPRLASPSRDLWVSLAVVASGLLWTLVAYAKIPDVALGFGSYFGQPIRGRPWPVPAEHGMPVWAIGFCWLATGILALAGTLFPVVDDFQTNHPVVHGALLVLLFVLVGRLTWL